MDVRALDGEERYPCRVTITSGDGAKLTVEGNIPAEACAQLRGYSDWAMVTFSYQDAELTAIVLGKTRMELAMFTDLMLKGVALIAKISEIIEILTGWGPSAGGASK